MDLKDGKKTSETNEHNIIVNVQQIILFLFGVDMLGRMKFTEVVKVYFATALMICSIVASSKTIIIKIVD